MDEKLFLNDSYLTETKSNLLSVTDDGELIFQKSVFYAMSGGQPGDEGMISWNGQECKIKGTIKDGNGNICLVPDINQKIPPLGVECTQIINWEKRFRYMRTHTALHLLSVVIPLPVTGGQISEIKGRLDFNMPNAMENKNELEDKLNQIIENDYAVTQSMITDQELHARPDLIKTMSVSPPKGAGKIRLIRIGNDTEQIDLQPCGGTHVNNTREIGPVRFGKVENKGKQNRRVSIHLDL